jgi:WhiB family transcriptional regulator, redox-sensing transcriptional regulator
MIDANKLSISKSWRTFGACLKEDPELFFPIGQSATAMRQALNARQICNGCPVMGMCLEWSLATGQDDGIWGGLDPVERRAISRRRRQVARLLNDQETNDFARGQVSS